jgi:hypothetical protein
MTENSTELATRAHSEPRANAWMFDADRLALRIINRKPFEAASGPVLKGEHHAADHARNSVKW